MGWIAGCADSSDGCGSEFNCNHSQGWLDRRCNMSRHCRLLAARTHPGIWWIQKRFHTTPWRIKYCRHYLSVRLPCLGVGPWHPIVPCTLLFIWGIVDFVVFQVLYLQFVSTCRIHSAPVVFVSYMYCMIMNIWKYEHKPCARYYLHLDGRNIKFAPRVLELTLVWYKKHSQR